MTEIRARLVDKDGNPLGTAANPLKISDHSISTATWGSITGTLSDQTDLNTSLTAKASSTSAAMSILVYDGTPSAGDLTTYDEIYTTPALCFAALPAIINHAVTIKIRKAEGAAYAASTLQRTVSAGSITIQGEYYYGAATVASAGSGTGKFNVIAVHSGLVQTGDKVFLMKYSSTAGSSTPSDGFIDTVASVDGTEVTLTTRTSDTFNTSWRYVIVRTECAGITVNCTNSVTIRGLYLNTPASVGVNIVGCFNTLVQYSIFETSFSGGALGMGDSLSALTIFWEGIAIKNSSTSNNAKCVSARDSKFYFRNSLFECKCATTAIHGGVLNLQRTTAFIYYSVVRDYETGTSNGIVCGDGSAITVLNDMFDGVSNTYKMAVALQAIGGSTIAVTTCTFGSYITTQKSPANWAATTDGSYIS